mmetsp:Transcript_16617/g.25854  ORF Transcript_16617/g.25854 Transcript_16617/m.25854 type:complete len:100 (+) Transcript_16617:2530-2829(+)
MLAEVLIGDLSLDTLLCLNTPEICLPTHKWLEESIVKGKKRKEVFVHKILPAGTVVEILHERHCFVDRKSRSFEAIGEYYGPDCLLKLATGEVLKSSLQ